MYMYKLLHTLSMLSVDVTLSIAQASYTVEEGTELSVCLTYSGGDLNGMTVTYNASTVDGTAAVSANGQ